MKLKIEECEMVDEYYTLVTDFYEYGWGDSFHFAHTKKGENHHDAMARHERRLAEELGLTANDHVIDVGCGVGGPARTIAKYAGSTVTGITINHYQIARAKNLTKAANLDDQVSFVQGDFTQLPFEEKVI